MFFLQGGLIDLLTRVAYSWGTWKPGSQEIYKLRQIFGRIHAIPQVDRASLTKESKFFLLELNSCYKNWFPVTRIDFVWPELLSFNKQIFIYFENIYSLWKRLFISFKIFTYRKKILLVVVGNHLQIHGKIQCTKKVSKV